MPLQLGCNYSPALLQLLRQGIVDVDWIKLSRPDALDEEMALARPFRPILLHCLGSAGRRPELWGGYQWDALNARLKRAGSPHIALHLEMRPEDWDEPLDLRYQSRTQARAMLERLIGAVRTVQQHVAVPLLVENIPYHGFRGVLRLVAQPEAIWQVMEETGVDMLLDSAHLRCSAHNLGVDARAYARALPLHRVREIHACGPRLDGEYLRDRHYELLAEDYEILQWLLGETRPQIVTLEYGGTGEAFETEERSDPAALEAQLKRLRDLV